MPAAAAPRQTGLKRLAVALACLCLVLFLLAIENRHAIEAWRTLKDEAVPAAGRVADWAGKLPSGAANSLSGLKAAVKAGDPPLAADAADAVLAGEYDPTSELTRVATGAVAFVGAELRFESGEVFRTEPLRIVNGVDVFTAGQTFAERLGSTEDAQIELRRIVAASPDQPVKSSTLCAGATPGAVALLHRRDQVDIMLFRAPAVIGPEAPPAAVCGIWSFRRK